MSEDREVRIICSILKERNSSIPIIQGSMTAPCHDCGVELLLSPTGIEIVLTQDAKPTCVYCANKVAPEDREHKKPTPAQIQEVLKAGMDPIQLQFILDNFNTWTRLRMAEKGQKE